MSNTFHINDEGGLTGAPLDFIAERVLRELGGGHPALTELLTAPLVANNSYLGVDQLGEADFRSFAAAFDAVLDDEYRRVAAINRGEPLSHRQQPDGRYDVGS